MAPAGQNRLSRRGLLKGLGTLGCSAAAFPALTGITLAAAPTDNRLVVIILRGAMDGLDVVRPLGDPDFAALRPGLMGDIPAGGSLDLGGFFALHPGLSPLMPLWQAGELAFAHAVSTPYRDKRSHFDGQDLLEAGSGAIGTGGAEARRDGWLNRLVQTIPQATSETAFAIGRENLRILSGDADVSRWYPGLHLQMGAAGEALLAKLYDGDPLFRAAAADALAISRDMQPGALPSGRPDRAIAAFAAERLRQETRIAAFSLSGWDTHRDQARVLPDLLGRLADTIVTLRDGLGPDWARTAVVAITEFGRTARQNGTGGTDHGTGGAMVLAGGAVRGGQVHADWPGVSEAALYARRDLTPTADVRAYLGWVIQDLFGTAGSTLEAQVFPGLDLGTNPGLLR